MKNKNLSLLALAFLILTSISLTSCGGEDEDPKPTKTDLELVKEGVVGTWTYVSAEITKNGITTHYTSGECANNITVGNVAVDVNYEFGTTPQVNVESNLALTETQNCTGNVYDEKGYKITEVDGIFTVTIYSGADANVIYTLLTTPDDINGNTVVVKSTLNGAERIVTYQKN